MHSTLNPKPNDDPHDVVVVAPDVVRVAPSDQEISHLLQQAARFQVLEQGGDRLIHRAGVVAMVEDVAVIVPRLAGAGEDLNGANAALNEPSCDQARVIELSAAIEIARGGRFAR